VGSVQLLGALQTVSCFGSRCVTLHHGITSQLCMPKDLLFHVVSSCVFFPPCGMSSPSVTSLEVAEVSPANLAVYFAYAKVRDVVHDPE
jgi:hypothetical protein